MREIGNCESLTVLNIYTRDLVTAWIDENVEKFEATFPLAMVVCEAYAHYIGALMKKYPTRKRKIHRLGDFFMYAVAAGGDMTPKLTESLLDDLSTDGEEIYSDKIKAFGANILKLLQIHGSEIPPSRLNSLNGW